MDTVSVVFASDNGYAQHLAVSATSMLKNASDGYPIDIYIFDTGISKENVSKIKNLENLRENTKVRFIDIDLSAFKDFPLIGTFTVGGEVKSTFTHAAYVRLLAPELLSHLDKVLYLDSDIAVCGDIKELWEEELAENLTLAVEERHNFHKERQQKFGMKADSPYFNSGIMSMNLSLFREINLMKVGKKIVEKHGDLLIYCDQDIMNLVCEGKWRAIHPKYNASFYIQRKQFQNGFISYNDKVICEAAEKPFVIHYAQRPKPWHYGCVDTRKSEYYKHLADAGFEGYTPTPPSLKERFSFYKQSTGLYLEKNIPFLHQGARFAWRKASRQS